jgi:hypothetical protein
MTGASTDDRVRRCARGRRWQSRLPRRSDRGSRRGHLVRRRHRQRLGHRHLGRRRSRRRRRRLCRHRRRRLGRGRGSELPRRQQAQRVDVAVLVGGDADAEMDVGLGVLRLGARPDRPDRVALGDHQALVDEQRAQLGVRHREAVRSPDRDHAPVAGHRPGERDHTRGGSPHRGVDRRPDVDAAVLPARIRVGAVAEWPDDQAVDGPQPRSRRRRGYQGREHEDGDELYHPRCCCRIGRHDNQGSGGSRRCQT